MPLGEEWLIHLLCHVWIGEQRMDGLCVLGVSDVVLRLIVLKER